MELTTFWSKVGHYYHDTPPLWITRWDGSARVL